MTQDYLLIINDFYDLHLFLFRTKTNSKAVSPLFFLQSKRIFPELQ